jgi:chromosome segregation ATPase
MTENVENMTLEQLKHIRASLELMSRDIREIKTRQGDTHPAVLALRRDQVNDAEITAHLQVQLNTVRDRLDHIERRLQLSN